MEMLPLLAETNRLVYAPLLLVVISLVYAGTRHESLAAIFRHATSFGGWTTAFMVGVATAIELMTFFQ